MAFLLTKNPTDWIILCNWDFDNFILADEPFLKSLPILTTCVLINNNWCGKLFSLFSKLL